MSQMIMIIRRLRRCRNNVMKCALVVSIVNEFFPLNRINVETQIIICCLVIPKDSKYC